MPCLCSARASSAPSPGWRSKSPHSCLAQPSWWTHGEPQLQIPSERGEPTKPNKIPCSCFMEPGRFRKIHLNLKYTGSFCKRNMKKSLAWGLGEKKAAILGQIKMHNWIRRLWFPLLSQVSVVIFPVCVSIIVHFLQLCVFPAMDQKLCTPLMSCNFTLFYSKIDGKNPTVFDPAAVVQTRRLPSGCSPPFVPASRWCGHHPTVGAARWAPADVPFPFHRRAPRCRDAA